MEYFEEDTVVTGEGVQLAAAAAPVSLRIASGAIDLAATLLVFGVTSGLIGGLLAEVNSALGFAIGALYALALIVFIPAIIETLTRGLSLGKFLVGLRIVRDDGGAVSGMQAFGRAISNLVETYMLFGSVSVTTSILNARAKRLGDLIVGTYALRTRGGAKTLPPVTMPPTLVDWARTADMTRLPDGLAINTRLLLARVHQLTPDSRSRMVERYTTRVRKHVAPDPPAGTHPEAYLAAVLATRRDREYATALEQNETAKDEGERLRRLPYGVPDVEN